MDTSSATEAREIGNRIIVAGIAAIVLILLIAAVMLFINLPDANAFNARVEQLFIANDTLTGNAEIKLLEILAQSGTAFSDTLSSYRFVIFVLAGFCDRIVDCRRRVSGHVDCPDPPDEPDRAQGYRGQFPADQSRSEVGLSE